MPLAWRDLAGGPQRWTLLTVPARLKRVRTDPWEEYWRSTQGLSVTAINALRRL